LVHENAFAFYDYQEKAFCVLDDSTFLWKYNVKKEKWEKSPIELRLEMPFETFLTDFIPLSDKGTPVYFVYGGCGVVYAKKGNVILRHDLSFYHKNQFDGSFFMDEGEPRIYGGYGLFTSKNIVTRYDTLENEWFVINTKNNPPPSGIKNIVLKNNHYYYVFDGLKGTSNQFSAMDNIWRLDLKSKKWFKLGKLNLSIQVGSKMTTNDVYQTRNNAFSCFSNMIISYNLDKLRYRKYSYNSSGLYVNIINVGPLFLIHKKSSALNSCIEMSDAHFLNKFEFEEGDMLMKENSSAFFVFVFTFIILTFISILFIKRRKREKKVNRQVVSNKKFALSMNEFNHNERELIRLLLLHKESGLEISFINDLVNYDQPSIDTLKKRREILLKDLRYKLSSKFNLSVDEVFFERRMEMDKRMKLLFLNEILPELLSN
jgi:hypothetical protein